MREKSFGRRRRSAVAALGCAAVSLAAIQPAAGQDLLAGAETVHVACETTALDVGERTARWALGEGFYGDDRERPGERSFAWTDRRAVAVILLDGPRPRRMRIVAGAGPEGQAVTPRWNGVALAARTLPWAWTELEWPLPAAVQRAGPNVLALEAARAVVLPPDPRRLGLRVDRIELDPPAPCSRDAPAALLGPFLAPPRLAPGDVLFARVALTARPRLRLILEGEAGAVAEWSAGPLEALADRHRLAVPESGRLDVEVEPAGCCAAAAAVFVTSRGPGELRVGALELGGDDRPAAWRRACGQGLPTVAVGLGIVLLLVAAAATGRRGGAGRDWLEPVLIAALALGVRLLYLHLFPASEQHGFADARGYVWGARRLLTDGISAWTDTSWHHWFSWIRPPGYFAFVALVLGPLGGDVATLAAIQAVLLAAAAAAVYLAAYWLFGRGAARAAGLLFALEPLAVTSASWTMTEALDVALLAVALAALVRASLRASWRPPLVAGIVFGLAALVRSAPLYYLPGAAMLLVLGQRNRRGLTAAAVLVGGMVAVVTPWCVRNSLLYGHLTGVDDMAVINLLQVRPDDRFVSTAGLDLDSDQGRSAYRHRIARANEGGRLARQGGAVLRAGLGRMVARPGETLRRFGANVRACFGPAEPQFMGNVLGARRSCTAVFVTDLLNGFLVLIAVLAAVGIAVGAGRVASWPLLLWPVFNLAVISLLFHPELRYTLTFLPALEVFAGAGLAALVAAARRAIGNDLAAVS